MSGGIAALARGAAVGRASVKARGVASVPAANLMSFIGVRSGETIICGAGDFDPVPLEEVEHVLRKMRSGVWAGDDPPCAT